MVEAGWQPDHQEVARIAKELLSTFSYLEKQKVHLQPVHISADSQGYSTDFMLQIFGQHHPAHCELLLFLAFSAFCCPSSICNSSNMQQQLLCSLDNTLHMLG